MMSEKTAQKILVLAREASERINESVKIVQEQEPPDEFERYRTAAGQVMGELYFSIIEPILSEHPQLTPPGLRPNSENAPK